MDQPQPMCWRTPIKIFMTMFSTASSPLNHLTAHPLAVARPGLHDRVLDVGNPVTHPSLNCRSHTCWRLPMEIFMTVFFMLTTERSTPPLACAICTSWLLADAPWPPAGGSWVRSSKMVAHDALALASATRYQMWRLFTPTMVWRWPMSLCTSASSCVASRTSWMTCGRGGVESWGGCSHPQRYG
eukprot:363985-Chlamydomonas_euryale.AAC.2